MKLHYTSERNIQILLSLLKQHGIKKVIASPGTTNMTFVASMQHDPWFEMYSAVDERSAAYMAVGIASETNEPVIITCTEATASRNYMSGLTEAYYRKLPVLAITGAHDLDYIGTLCPQVIDRTILPKDIALLSINVQPVVRKADEENCIVRINKALLELKRRGGGPVHINLVSTMNRDYSETELPNVRTMRRIVMEDVFPQLDYSRIAVLVGAHRQFSKDEEVQIETFCKKYNAVVFCDHTSSYDGEYKVNFSLVASQHSVNRNRFKADLLISIGEVSADEGYISADTVWRVSPDGEIRDIRRQLSVVFEMEEISFFKKYNLNTEANSDLSYYKTCIDLYKDIADNIPELPLSNVWIAKNVAAKVPENSTVYLAILNTLRSWNYFQFKKGVKSFSNVGGFGIDGGLSSLVGASLCNPDKLYFCMLGDLSFFYDMNVLGNRHLSNNLRILLINNGCGTEFRNYSHPAYGLGYSGNDFVAAAGHFGQKSKTLVKHYVEDLGFRYFSAENKEEFVQSAETFFASEISDAPMVFEVFTNQEDESEALKMIRSIADDPEAKSRLSGKEVIRKMIGEKYIQKIRTIVNN